MWFHFYSIFYVCNKAFIITLLYRRTTILSKPCRVRVRAKRELREALNGVSAQCGRSWSIWVSSLYDIRSSFTIHVHGADTIVSIYPIYTFITDSYLEYKLFPLHCSDGRSYWIGLLLINDIPVLRLAGIYSLRSFIQYWNVHIDEQIQRQVMRYLFHAQTTWLCHTERAPFASIFAFLRTLALTHNSNDWLPEYLVSNFIWKH